MHHGITLGDAFTGQLRHPVSPILQNEVTLDETVIIEEPPEEDYHTYDVSIEHYLPSLLVFSNYFVFLGYNSSLIER